MWLSSKPCSTQTLTFLDLCTVAVMLLSTIIFEDMAAMYQAYLELNDCTTANISKAGTQLD